MFNIYYKILWMILWVMWYFILCIFLNEYIRNLCICKLVDIMKVFKSNKRNREWYIWI